MDKMFLFPSPLEVNRLVYMFKNSVVVAGNLFPSPREVNRVFYRKEKMLQEQRAEVSGPSRGR